MVGQFGTSFGPAILKKVPLKLQVKLEAVPGSGGSFLAGTRQPRSGARACGGPGAVAWFSRRCCGYNCWATKGQFAPRVGTQIAGRVVTDRDLLEGACAREVHHQYVLVLSRRKPFPRIFFTRPELKHLSD